MQLISAIIKINQFTQLWRQWDKYVYVHQLQLINVVKNEFNKHLQLNGRVYK